MRKTKTIDTFLQIVWSRMTVSGDGSASLIVCQMCCHRRPPAFDRDYGYHLHLPQSISGKDKKVFSSSRTSSVRNLKHSNKLFFRRAVNQSVRSFVVFLITQESLEQKQNNRSLCFQRISSIIFKTINTLLNRRNVCKKSSSLWWTWCIGLNMCSKIQRAELGKQVLFALSLAVFTSSSSSPPTSFY